jgi:hypothetical protein
MTVGAICTRLPETTARLETVRRAAEQMAGHDVGALVVTDGEGRVDAAQERPPKHRGRTAAAQRACFADPGGPART